MDWIGREMQSGYPNAASRALLPIDSNVEPGSETAVQRSEFVFLQGIGIRPPDARGAPESGRVPFTRLRHPLPLGEGQGRGRPS